MYGPKWSFLLMYRSHNMRHGYSAGWRWSTRHPGIGASQLGIRDKVNDYLGSSVGVELRYTST